MTRQRVRRNHTPEQKINLLRRCVDMGDQERANVAEALVDGELFVAADAEGLVELAARLEGVGDLPQGDGPSSLRHRGARIRGGCGGRRRAGRAPGGCRRSSSPPELDRGRQAESPKEILDLARLVRKPVAARNDQRVVEKRER
jgi:hypothetical protein